MTRTGKISWDFVVNGTSNVVNIINKARVVIINDKNAFINDIKTVINDISNRKVIINELQKEEGDIAISQGKINVMTPNLWV